MTKGDLGRFSPQTNSSKPISIIKLSGDNQIGTGGYPLTKPFKVKVADADGKPVSQVPVTFSILEGKGFLSKTKVKTNSKGIASTVLTISEGTHKVGVTFNGYEGEQVLFSAISAILEEVGKTQMSQSIMQVEVRVKDSSGNGLEGVEVIGEVKKGNATISTSNKLSYPKGNSSLKSILIKKISTLTDADGYASFLIESSSDTGSEGKTSNAEISSSELPGQTVIFCDVFNTDSNLQTQEFDPQVFACIVKGKVYNINDSTPIKGATITVEKRTTKTISKGLYYMILQPGTFTVNVKANGYISDSKDNVSVCGGAIATVNFGLNPLE